MAVLNFYKIGCKVPDGAVYIGRANTKYGLQESKYHNPFKIDEANGVDRKQAVSMFRKDLYRKLKEGVVTERELMELVEHDLVCYCEPKECHGDVLLRAGQYFKNLSKDRKIIFDRFAGYQVNTKGDKRFSPFFTRVRDGRTIEEIYQCDIKGYDKGGTQWRVGKGKPPLDKDVDLFTSYFELWEEWASVNYDLMNELNELLKLNLYRIGDKFGTTNVNQGLVLSILLNEMFYGHERLLIAGGRELTLDESDITEIKSLFPKISMVVSGGAKGIDKEGERFASANGIERLLYKPKWEVDGLFDKGAGMKRNKILVEKSSAAIFFWDGSSKGTKDAIESYKRTGKKFHVITKKGTVGSENHLVYTSNIISGENK